MISSINANVSSYTSSVKSFVPKADQQSQTQRVDVNSASGDNEAAEKLLSSFSKPSTGGLLLAGVPDLNNPQAMERESRMTSLFNSEQVGFERQKSGMISSGRANGKSAEEILNDILGLYDSQSDILKTGIGWNGDVFAFDSSSPEGLARTQSYVTDAVNIRA